VSKSQDQFVYKSSLLWNVGDEFELIEQFENKPIPRTEVLNFEHQPEEESDLQVEDMFKRYFD
jgi:hypothetical protein